MNAQQAPNLANHNAAGPLGTVENLHPHYVIAQRVDRAWVCDPRHGTHNIGPCEGGRKSKLVEAEDRRAAPMNEASFPFRVEANAGNHLAWMNAILGLQRTLMAAERTAVTLIAFGFTVAQVFKNMQQIVPRQYLVLGPDLPRSVGLLMIATGVGSLALFTWQYLRAVSYLGAEPFTAISMRIKVPLHQLTCLSAYAIMFLGTLGFGSVFVSY